MTSPIENCIGCVFIPVSDMPRAIAWYSQLFGLPVQTAVHATSHEGHIYELPMQGAVSLLLDSHKPVCNSSQPLCFFWTADLSRAYTFLLEMTLKLWLHPKILAALRL